MGRHRAIPSHPVWNVITTPTGRWMIVDQDGNDPFQHPDRLERLYAVYLASQAGPLRAAVEELSRVVENLTEGGFHGYEPLVHFAHVTVSMTRPPLRIVEHVRPVRHQGDLDLEAA
jgi:hypothetical protein